MDQDDYCGYVRPSNPIDIARGAGRSPGGAGGVGVFQGKDLHIRHAGHRDTGVFEAARYGIDRLKQIVPVWKKEVSPDGEEWVEGDYFPAAGE